MRRTARCTTPVAFATNAHNSSLVSVTNFLAEWFDKFGHYVRARLCRGWQSISRSPAEQFYKRRFPGSKGKRSMPGQTPVEESFSRRQAARGRKTGKRDGKSCWRRESHRTIRNRYTRGHLRNGPDSSEVSMRSSFDKKSTSSSESRSSRCAAIRSWNLFEQSHCLIPKSHGTIPDTVNIFSFKYFTLHLYFVIFLCAFFICVLLRSYTQKGMYSPRIK